MNRITKGEGGNGVIYERLRKRSYRRMQRSDALWTVWDGLFDLYDTEDGEVDAAWDAAMAANWHKANHEAYLAGVRDALVDNERAWGRTLSFGYDVHGVPV